MVYTTLPNFLERASFYHPFGVKEGICMFDASIKAHAP
jgi:hypothetical protein